ncbi:DUF3862 domain-containing protein [Aminipila terrae]|uniref:DUF3862 domain-containing protein n=1 Tax=Aminipila terrae TaxID=2697030 RepID=A0A6P1MKI4_9FIRM|nr:DUF3862 domain-containing protein [Aminipila terrae]QHI73663.1 DUF3862 domain-containing protein [Aminipila terrae]
MANKIRTCKSCGEELEKGSKVTCPKCGTVNTKPVYTRAWFIILCIVVALGVIGSLGGKDDSDNSSKSASTEPATQETASKDVEESKINYDNFLSINMGSSYTDVVALLGEDGSETSSSEIAGIKTVIYTWSGSGIANMNVTIQNDKVVSKAQLGLKDANDGITLEKYNQIKEGMTYAQVKDILGEGQLLSEAETMGIQSSVYEWINKNGANANLTFQGDKLQMKAQFNLE